jgi:hypothetical protein
MVWTKNDTQIHAHSTRGPSPLIPRTQNTALLELTKDEALAFIQEISKAFGAEGVPSKAIEENIYIVIENPVRFWPKDAE